MLSAKNDANGDLADWWFMYKLPEGAGPKKSKTVGNEYLYYDGLQQKKLTLSEFRLGTAANGALYNTLKQLNNQSSEMGWIHYNDEYPYSLKEEDWPARVKPKYYSENAREKDRGHPVDHAHNGHCKGTLAFDLQTDTAFWLSHSTPRIPFLHEPDDGQYFFPSYAYTYAQTFICITLKDVATANQIAEILATQHEPQVFGCQLPGKVSEDSPYASIWKLAQGTQPPGYSEEYVEKHGKRAPADISFKSKADKEFRLIAKSGAWYDDFWINLIGPKLGTDLRIETWRRLTTTATLPVDEDGGKPEFGENDFVTEYKGKEYHHEFEEGDGEHIEDEITNIDLKLLKDHQNKPLEGISWAYTRDHSKWAISEPETERGDKTIDTEDGTAKSWVSVADMNRMTSQARRGGGAICFHEPELWKVLNEIERIDGKIT